MLQGCSAVGCVGPPLVAETQLLHGSFCVGLAPLQGWLRSPAVALLGALMNGGEPQYGHLQCQVVTAVGAGVGRRPPARLAESRGWKALTAAGAGSLVSVVSSFMPWDRNHAGEVTITMGVA